MNPGAPAERPGEFEVIARVFAPLAAAEAGSLGLTDDAAVLAPAAGSEFVITTDMLVAGVHFLADDPPELVARKMLRVNLSDLAAMGAAPRVYFLGLAVPASAGLAWFESFAAGLATDQAAFGINLAGGDTTATPGPLTLSLTAVGEVPTGKAIRRSTAAAGDDIWVTGTIGDAALALAVMEGRAPDASERDVAALVGRYRLPEPRTRFGPALRGIASAAIDVSDGLVADLGHICETSGIGAEIGLADVPFSPAAASLIGRDPAFAERAVTGGDDYELLFTAPPGMRPAVIEAARRLDVPATRIGQTTAGSGVVLRAADGKAIVPPRAGWQHF